MKLARQVSDALDKNSFQPWAFASIIGSMGVEVEERLFRLFKATLESWVARKEMGLCNYVRHHRLANVAEELLEVIDRHPPI